MSDNYIDIQNLTKSFMIRGERLDVLKGILLSVSKEDVFGIIGLSGAGKSTLARCINRLETPDTGQIIIGGVDMLSLPKHQLLAQRQRIGMIFQTFNLFEAKTVYKNIAYPLAIRGVKKAERDRRVREIAEVVGLQDKLNACPAGLSGGQKQCVGIARAGTAAGNAAFADPRVYGGPLTRCKKYDILLFYRKPICLHKN